MARRFILGIGDGPTDDSLELHDLTHYIVDQNGLNMPPADERSGTRTIELRVHVIGGDPNSVFNAQAEIQRKLWQGREGIGPHRQSAGVVLSMNLKTDEWAYADVLSGTVTIPPDGLRVLHSNIFVGVIVQLTCRRYFRGERVINALTQEDVASGTQLYLPSVAGTAPAIARLILTDTSTNEEAINRVRIGVQGLSSGLYANDVTFTNPLTALDGVQTDGDGSDSHGASYATITAQNEWQSVARLQNPSVRTSGLYDLYLRWRDHAAILGTPTNLTLQPGAITYIHGHGKSVTGATSLTFDWTAQIPGTQWYPPPAEGNLMYMAVSTENVTVTPPGGWTLIQQVGTTRKLSTYYKVAGSSEPVNITLNFSGSTDAMVRYSEWSGITDTSPLDDSDSASGSGSTVSSGTTDVTSQANTLVIASWLWAGDGDHDRRGSLPAGYQDLGGVWTGSMESFSAYSVRTTTSTQNATITADTSSWVGAIAAFKGITASAPTASSGVYQVRVTALDNDGNESLASFPASVELSEAGGVTARWSAPSVGAIAQYRVYWTTGGAWNYIDTGSSATSYAIVSDTPDGTGDPPVSSSLRSLARALIGVGSGMALRPTAARSSQVANEEWELTYLDTVHLPPDAAGEGDEERAWTVVVQVRNDALNPDIDLDALILRPHNACAIDAEYVDSDGVHLSLDRPHDWTLDTRRDGRTSVVLSTSGDDAAGAMQSGAFCLLPGDNAVLVVLDSIRGVNDLENTTATVRIDYTPRWDWLPGQDWGG